MISSSLSQSCPAPLPHPHPPLPRPHPAPLSHSSWLLLPSDKVLKVSEEFIECHTSSYHCFPLKLEVLLLETPTVVDDPVTMISVITSQLACIFDLLIRFCRSLMRTTILLSTGMLPPSGGGLVSRGGSIVGGVTGVSCGGTSRAGGGAT